MAILAIFILIYFVIVAINWYFAMFVFYSNQKLIYSQSTVSPLVGPKQLRPEEVDRLLLRSQSEDIRCAAPIHISPDDPAVNRFLTNVSLDCPFRPPLTYLSEDEGLIRTSKNKSEEFKCFATYFGLYKTKLVYHGFYEILSEGINIRRWRNLNNVNVTCYDPVYQEVYQNIHHLIPRSPRVQRPSTPSVLVLFIESLSQLSFYRSMKRTHESLNNYGNFQILKGFVKPLGQFVP